MKQQKRKPKSSDKLALELAGWLLRSLGPQGVREIKRTFLWLIKLTGKAVDIFGSYEEASKWLHTPHASMGAVPIDHARSAAGRREVYNVLRRINRIKHS